MGSAQRVRRRWWRAPSCLCVGETHEQQLNWNGKTGTALNKIKFDSRSFNAWFNKAAGQELCETVVLVAGIVRRGVRDFVCRACGTSQDLYERFPKTMQWNLRQRKGMVVIDEEIRAVRRVSAVVRISITGIHRVTGFL